MSIYIIILFETQIYSLGMSNCNRTGLSRHLWRKVWGYSRGRMRNFDWTGLIGLHLNTINVLYDNKKLFEIWHLITKLKYLMLKLCEQSFDTECETLEEEECNTIYEEICEPVYKVCKPVSNLVL